MNENLSIAKKSIEKRKKRAYTWLVKQDAAASIVVRNRRVSDLPLKTQVQYKMEFCVRIDFS